MASHAPPVPAPEPEEAPRPLSPRMEVVRWVKEQIRDAVEVSIPALDERAVDRFGSDPEWVQRFLLMELEPFVAEVCRNYMATSRTGVVALVPLGDKLVAPETIRESGAKLAQRWADWWENANGRHIRVLDMTKADCLSASEARLRLARTNVELAHLWAELAAELADDETVGQRFSGEEITARLRKIQARPRLTLRPSPRVDLSTLQPRRRGRRA